MIPYVQFPDLQFSEENHRYTLNDVDCPSVTKILSSVARRGKNEEWVPIADNRFFSLDDTAPKFGKAFHKAVSFNLRDIDIDCPEELQPWYKQFLRWRKEHSWLQSITDENNMPLIEYPMAHTILGYCGTVDWIAKSVEPCPARYKNSVFIIDWKTSTQEAKYWRLQIAGYEELFRHVFNGGIVGKKIIRMAVRFESDGYYPETRITNHEDTSLFMSVLNIFKY